MDNEDVEPIDNADFNIYKPREGNPERLDKINKLAAQYWQIKGEADLAREQLAAEIVAAKATGHSYSQLTEASGLTLGTIQRMLGYKQEQQRRRTTS